MTGYRTRQQLADALHGEIAADALRHDVCEGIPAHGCTEDHDYAYRNGRASDKLSADHRSPFTADSAPADRRERRYRAVFKAAIWCVLLTAAFMAGLNARIKREAAPRGQLSSVDPYIEYRIKAARLALNSMVCKQSLTEPCPRQSLICLHKDVLGQPSVSIHC